MKKKLYEYVGYRKYAIVVAADCEADAMRAVEALDTWGNLAEDIGFTPASDLELVDIRRPTKSESIDLNDVANLIV